jgi:two-component system, sensor histidine kinase YesM
MKRGRSLASKIYVGVILVTLLAILMLGFGSYFRSSIELNKQTEQYLQQLVRTITHQTDMYLKTYEQAITTFVIHTDLRQFIEAEKDDYDYVHFYSQVKRYLMEPTLTFYPQINLISVIGEDGRSILEQRVIDASINSFILKNRYVYLKDQIGAARYVIVNNGISNSKDLHGMITIASKVREWRSLNETAIVAIEIRASELSQLWEEVTLSEGGFFFIADQRGQLIYHPDASKVGTILDPSLRTSDMDEMNLTVEMDGKDRLIVSKMSEYSGWRLYMSLPVEDVHRPISNIREAMIWVGLFALISTMFVAVWFASTVSKPIQRLYRVMREAELDNWQLVEVPKQDDEIARLYQSYNHMVTRLTTMVDTVYREKMERQTAEFQSLQLQINPHFLYNTLTVVYGYAVEQDSTEIAEMSKALSFMFRYAVQTNLEEITVANELNHVLNYMTIMNHRNQSGFEVDVLIPPSLLLEHMVRLTLQPLVENSMQHAFPMGIQEGHVIRINASLEEEKGQFIVTVQDNGIGIVPERLAEIRARLAENRLAVQELPQSITMHGSGGSIGLMNVHRRIQIVFGDEYGLRIDSIYGEGTTVTMVMPRSAASLHRPD